MLAALKVMKSIDVTLTDISLEEKIISKNPALSLPGMRELHTILTDMSRKGNFSAVYTAGHNAFMISHEENVFNIIDTHKVPHLCGGNGNAVIVKGSLISTCSWLWKHLSVSSVTNEDCHSLSVIVGKIR